MISMQHNNADISETSLGSYGQNNTNDPYVFSLFKFLKQERPALTWTVLALCVWTLVLVFLTFTYYPPGQ
jgi:hypothetical protein